MTFSFVDIKGHRYVHDRTPDECPICHFAMQPTEVTSALVASAGEPSKILEIVFQCPRHECGSYFIARYDRTEEDIPTNASATGLAIGYGIRQFIFREAVPRTPLLPAIPEEIKAVSLQFPEIYAQALAAESYGLTLLAGVGYRKALEFLVKDYCIAIHPEAANQIRSVFLGPCIKSFVTDPNVRACAERAVWLGNDEAHYVRKWANKDLEDMKRLMLLTINWMHSDILTREYEKDMQ